MHDKEFGGKTRRGKDPKILDDKNLKKNEPMFLIRKCIRTDVGSDGFLENKLQ